MNRFFRVFLAFLCTLLFPTFICEKSVSFSYSPIALVFMAGVYWLLEYTSKRRYHTRIKLYAHMLGLMLSVMTAFGCYLEAQGTIPYRSIRLLSAIVLYAHIYADILCLLWSSLECFEESLRTGREQTRLTQRLGQGLEMLFRHPVLIFLILLLCWTPCYLSIFPGNFFYDAGNEFAQYTQGYRGEFPMLHSVLIIFFLNTSYSLTGAYNPGIAAYVILQMVLLSGLFSYILCQLYRLGINKFLLGILTVYYAAFPLIHVLVTTSVRDVLFSGLLTYTIFQAYLLARDPGRFWGSIRQPLIFGLSIALTPLSRTNGVGALLFIVLCIVSLGLLLGSRKENRRGVSILTASMLGGYLLVHLSLTAVCQPFTPAKLSSSMAFFTQPLARAYYYEQDTWTPYQKSQFETYFDMEKVRYVPENADTTKWYCTVDESTFKPFLRFWGSIGIRHPSCYLDAILANSAQMWFPCSIVDGYVESGVWDFEKTLYFFTDWIETPGQLRSLMPNVRQFYEKLGFCITFEKIPVVSMLFSIGFQFWLLLNCIFYASYRRCRYLFLPLGILLAYTLLSSFVPLVYLRYFSALFFCFPMVAVFTLQPGINTNHPPLH